MSLVSVPAIYDGKNIRLLESVSVKSPYRVVVTFLEPIRDDTDKLRRSERFWASFGSWESEETAEETVKRIYGDRCS
ncbi:MAG: hypothetical protein HZC38_21350 [Chloroflexi bacterium]|nr:hypothetical protein [Chloroflexota bacterium]MBI5715952.1 hypothetical protein [Chloroflexota bacterium]